MVTIIIPTYRRPAFLREALESCLSQTYKNIQILVSDNASGDETYEIVKSMKDSRITYFVHERPVSMLENYASSLKKVTTPFFSFLSDDDLLLPSFVETALNGFSLFPDIAFFSASTAAILYPEKRTIDIPLRRWPREGRFGPCEALPWMLSAYPIPITVLFRTSEALQTEIDFNNPTVWDCDFLIQIAQRCPIAICKKIEGIFRSHPDSFSFKQDFRVPFLRLYDRVQSSKWLIEPFKSEVRDKIEEMKLQGCYGSMVWNMKRGDFKEVKAISALLRKDYPFNFKRYTVSLIFSFFGMLPLFQPFFLFLLEIRRRLKKAEVSLENDWQP